MIIYDKECHSCGAPSNGLAKCIWCGSAILFRYVPDSEHPRTNSNDKINNNLRSGLSDAIDSLTGIKLF